jgi:hypothetical protein
MELLPLDSCHSLDCKGKKRFLHLNKGSDNGDNVAKVLFSYT